ncbi:hypothetical protein AB1Y20_022297 [Prymnesium parvum]|uniref:Uncharacterized protein n=1 Tax=Prymnesium parvum TaxID=97485 RepID=A0AB34JGN7_PRYPA
MRVLSSRKCAARSFQRDSVGIDKFAPFSARPFLAMALAALLAPLAAAAAISPRVSQGCSIFPAAHATPLLSRAETPQMSSAFDALDEMKRKAWARLDGGSAAASVAVAARVEAAPPPPPPPTAPPVVRGVVEPPSAAMGELEAAVRQGQAALAAAQAELEALRQERDAAAARLQKLESDFAQGSGYAAETVSSLGDSLEAAQMQLSAREAELKEAKAARAAALQQRDAALKSAAAANGAAAAAAAEAAAARREAKEAVRRAEAAADIGAKLAAEWKVKALTLDGRAIIAEREAKRRALFERAPARRLRKRDWVMNRVGRVLRLIRRK